MDYVKALYDFKGGESDDLPFSEGDVLVVLEKDGSGWWTGEHTQSGKKGDFPSNYVEQVTEKEAISIIKQKASKKKAPKKKPETFKGDPVDGVRVTGTEVNRNKMLMVKIEAKTRSGKSRLVKKSMFQFRGLDEELRKLNPSFERELPASWSDSASLGVLDSKKREKALELYLSKFIGNEISDYLLLMWLFPGDKVQFDTSNESLLEAGSYVRSIPEDGVSKASIPVLALVEFTWVPQDDAELSMEETQIIAILSQDTGSPGWWEGCTVDNKVGILPYNHVELLDPRVGRAVALGTPLEKATTMNFSDEEEKDRKSKSRISLSLFSSKRTSKKKAQAVKAVVRPKKYETEFTTCSLDSFDRLIDQGFVMESKGRMLGMEKPSDGPKTGDFVQLSYVAYLWDAQKQSIIEFAASDMDSKLAKAGRMEFFVGKGEVIKGIDHAVARMRKGQSVRLIVTPQLAYGIVGNPPDVPPDSHVVYDLTLDNYGNEVSLEDDDDFLPPPPPEEANFRIPSTRPAAKMSSKHSPKNGKPPLPSASSKPKMFQPSDLDVVLSPTSSALFSKPTAAPVQQQKRSSLQEAIARRRAKVDQQPQVIAQRAPPQQAKANFPARERMQLGAAPPEHTALKQNKMPLQKFTVKELQALIQFRQLEKFNIDPGAVEDALNDAEFKKAFEMSRTDFLLKPRWRQQALKRGVGLF